MVSVTDEWISDLLVELELVERDGDGLVYRCGTGLTLSDESMAYMLDNYEKDVRSSYEMVLDEIKVSILSEIEDDFVDACKDFWEGTPESYAEDMDYIKNFVWRIVRVEMDETSLLDTRACMNLFYYGEDASLAGWKKDVLNTDLSKIGEDDVLSWLVDTQGYKMEDVARTYETCETKSVFMRSLVGALMEMDADDFGVEMKDEIGILRDTMATNLLTFFVDMRWGDVMDVMTRDCYVKLGPHTRVGIHDIFNDTLHEIRLEYGVIFDKDYILMEFDGIGGVRDTIGKSDDFYRDTYYR